MDFFLVLLGLSMFLAYGLALIGVPVLFRRLNTLNHQLDELQRQLSHKPSESRVENSAAPEAVPDSEPFWKDELASDSVYEPDPEPVHDTSSASEPEPVESAPTPSPWASTKTPDPERTPRQMPRLFQRLLAMNLTAQVGGILLIFGAVFLGKYASDIGLLTLNAKLILMAVVSAGLIGAGIRFQPRLKVYADVLQGTGLAGWLVTLFVAHLLYGQLHWVLVVVAGSLAVALIGYRALRQESQWLAMIAFLGGFLTPFIASSEVSSLWRLFAYLSVLNVAVIWICWQRPWRWLMREAYVGTFGLIAALMLAEYLQGDLYLAVIQWPFSVFLIVSLMLFSILAVRWSDEGETGAGYAKHASGLLFGTPATAAIGLQAVLHPEPVVLASVLFGLGLWYAVLAIVGRRGMFWAVAVVLGSAAVPYAFNDALTSLTYSLEGAAFVFWAARHYRRLPLIWGLGIQLIAAAFAFRLFQDPVIRDEQLWVSWFLYGGVILAAALSAWWLDRKREPVTSSWTQLVLTLLGAALAVWFYQWGFWLAENNSRLDTLTFFAILSAGTAAVLAVLAWQSGWTRLWYTARWSSLTFIPAAALTLYDYPAQSDPLTLLVLAGMSGALLYGQVRLSRHWFVPQPWDGFPVWFGHIAIMAFSLQEVPAQFTDWSASLMLVAVFGPFVFMQHGLKALLPAAPYRGFARWLCIFIVAVLVGYSCTRLGNYAPLPFWPLLHPILLLGMLGCVLLYRVVRRHPGWRLAWVVLAGGVLTMELNRWLFHYAGIAYNPDAWLASALTQMIWSLAWTLLGGALMISGTRTYASRSRWTLGAAILAIIVVKLFVLDLSQVDTLYRILSFLGVGGLLLGIGYVAPMPQREAR